MAKVITGVTMNVNHDEDDAEAIGSVSFSYTVADGDLKKNGYYDPTVNPADTLATIWNAAVTQIKTDEGIA
jgi:hypothetical protein